MAEHFCSQHSGVDVRLEGIEQKLDKALEERVKNQEYRTKVRILWGSAIFIVSSIAAGCLGWLGTIILGSTKGNP